jgi:hypothetical protein
MTRLLLVFALVGCHSPKDVQRPAVGPRIPAIKLCQTTEAELRAALGNPSRDGVLHQARVMSWIVSDDGLVKYLAVLLDTNGVVIDEIWNVPTEIPWVPTDQCSTKAAGL